MEGTQAATAGRVPVPPGFPLLWYRKRLMERGYIHVWRAIQDTELWKDKPFSRAQAWIDLIMIAQHRDGKIMTSRGFTIEVKRGDVLYGLDFFRKRWGWGKGRVLRFKQYLISQDMARQVGSQRNFADSSGKTYPKTDPKFNILSIQNYNYYQAEAIKKRTLKRTFSGPQVDPPNTLIKNEQCMSAKKADPDVKTFILEWEEIWTQKFGEPYTISWGKEGKLVKEILKTHSLQDLRELRDEFFRSQDQFIKAGGYSIGVFKTQLNRLVVTKRDDPVEQARREMREGKL
jgi:hypothetical protein